MSNDTTYESFGGEDTLDDDQDIYAGAYETTEGRVYTVAGGDWDDIVVPAEGTKERVIVNMGPQHPSTHGVLRLVLELDGETVTDARCSIGYLHTGIEKNLEYRTWTQGVTYVTRMDYVASMSNEASYVLAVEKLLGITDQIPARANLIRVIALELARLSSHLVALGSGGMELGHTTAMTNCFRERELILDMIEMLSGLRMNNAFLRPGGVAGDIPAGGVQKLRDLMTLLPKQFRGIHDLLENNGIFVERTRGVGYLDLTGCVALGITGPILRSAGMPWDLRKSQPYFGYEKFDFEVPTEDTCDAYGRFLVRLHELYESVKIIEQALDMLEPGPVMIEDKKIGWPAQLSIGSDGQGNSLEHIKHIMSGSMEALIHHFKLVTEGFRVPAGQVYAATEHPKGECGAMVVSDGGTRPYRVHIRDASFTNLQAVAAMCVGGQIGDVVVAVASIDPVMGGVDR